jgi:phosphoesterase RecJ-like protein
MKVSTVLRHILQAIRRSRSICVVGHVRPDGDCIGSQLALTVGLRNLGKQVTCWNEDGLPAKLAFLDPEHLMQKPRRGGQFDCVIAVDSASLDRLGSATPCIARRKLLINIDHHQSNTHYGDLNWVQPDSASTGELIYRLFCAARWPINPLIADCLFAAVSTDTGSFQYPSTRPDTLYMAGQLLERGANLATVCQHLYHSLPLAHVRLLRRVYARFKLTHGNQIAYFWLRKRDYAQAGAKPADSEGLIDHLRAIQPVVVACLFEQMEPRLIRVSLRSKDHRVNVGQIATALGGGGHQAAAGARIRGTPAAVQRRVLDAIAHALRAARYR